MIEILPDVAKIMVDHAIAAYPNECCGILIGSESSDGHRLTIQAVPCHNAYQGDQKDRFLIDPQDQINAERHARSLGLGVIGFFHSHPDEGAYFSQTDLKNHWPFYSNIVLSIRQGAFAEAKCFRVDIDQSASEEEELLWPKS
jgi:proteasome lid subunit RPN8/RPN11